LAQPQVLVLVERLKEQDKGVEANRLEVTTP